MAQLINTRVIQSMKSNRSDRSHIHAAPVSNGNESKEHARRQGSIPDLYDALVSRTESLSAAPSIGQVQVRFCISHAALVHVCACLKDRRPWPLAQSFPCIIDNQGELVFSGLSFAKLRSWINGSHANHPRHCT